MKLYLAGPMTGHSQFNFKTFMRYAELLRERGHEVINPAEESLKMHDLNWSGDLSEADMTQLGTTPWEEYLQHDLLAIDTVEAVAVLPGWQDSKGASREVDHAHASGKPVYHAVLLATGEYGDSISNAEVDFDVEDDRDDDPDITPVIREPIPGEQGYVHPNAEPREEPFPEGFATSDEYMPEEVQTATAPFVFYEADPERHESQTGGVKDNVNKPRLELIPSLPLFKAGEVLAFGARKYKPHNWRLGLSWEETYGSLQRHLAAWHDGEDLDRESGMHHIAHAMCQMLFLAEFVFRGTGEDDRFVSLPKEQARTDQ